MCPGRKRRRPGLVTRICGQGSICDSPAEQGMGKRFLYAPAAGRSCGLTGKREGEDILTIGKRRRIRDKSRPAGGRHRDGPCRTLCAILVCLTACLLLTGCGARQMAVSAGLGQSPYYHLGDTQWDHGGIEEYFFDHLDSSYNEIYRELYSRLSQGEDQGDLYAQVDAEDFWKAYFAVLADHPELFWIGASAQAQTSSLTGKVVSYKIESTVDPAQRADVSARLEAAADACIAQTDQTWSDYGRIKSVYEYLIRTVDYDVDAPDSQCVQSALLNGRSVCAGYAKAFQYILHRMGYFCTYVTGTIRGGGDHAWNIVRIDDRYYHVDVTWGDPVFADTQESGTGISVTNYNYLCCTDDEILSTHQPDQSIPLPACTDDSYNFYRINGMYYETYDYNTVYNALMDSVWNGRSSIVMKFGSDGAYQTAKYELFTNKIYRDAAQYLMEQNGVNSWNTRYSCDDAFHVITIQWY